MTFTPYGIEIGFITISYYGLIITSGAILAALLASRMLKEKNIHPDVAWDALIWAMVLGVIGARIYHIFTPSQELIDAGVTTGWYLTHPLDALDLRNGGLGLPGALLGGVLGLWIYARRNRRSLATLLDVAAPGVALAQAIGRWGNFINHELYGPPTDLPWGIPIPLERRLSGYESFERFHPLFLYESLWNLANFILLYWLWRRHRERLLPGDLFLIYLITYPVGRFLLEYLRLDYVPLGGLNLNQTLSIVVVIVSAIAIYLRHRNLQSANPSD